MQSPLEFQLNPLQVEYIQAYLPVSYSLHLSSLTQPREQRITKKVSKFDASVQQLQKDSNQIEESIKRPQRNIPQLKDYKDLANDHSKKGLSFLQKLKSHPAFDEVHASVNGQINIDNIEASFQQGGSINGLYNEVRKLFKLSFRKNPKDTPLYEATVQLENHFNEVFKQVQPPKKKPISIPQSTSKSETAMTYMEKKQLGHYIRELPVEYLRGVWDIVQGSVKAEGDEELEFDIDQLPLKIARKLEQFVLSKMTQKKIKIDTPAQNNSVKSINQDSSFPSESSD